MRMSHWALLVGGLAIAGCGRGGERAATTRDTGGMMGHTDSGGMGMGRMDSGGMGMGNMQGMAMMSGMRAHMDSVMRMSPQQMQAMMAGHEHMASQMMDAMGADMRQMNMSGDPKWNALADSVKRDLSELPALRGQALTTRMRAHMDRMRRLMATHQGMMENMRPQ
jgi:hypothetical protein